MFFHFLAVAAVGFFTAGCVMAAVRCFKGKAPKFIVLASAGLGMIAYNVWEEYSWFDRNALPMKAEGMIVVQTYAGGVPWRPWTYVFPVVSRFMAWKPTEAPRPTKARLIYGGLHLVARRADEIVVSQVYDCDRGMSAELSGDVAFDGRNRPTNLRWTRLDSTDSLFAAVCSNAS